MPKVRRDPTSWEHRILYKKDREKYRVWGIRPAKVCEASKLQSLFGASRLKASKPQSCKASLAPHASKPQSSKASLAPHASKPQSCKASLAPHASKPQSLKAWTLGCFGALALGALALWRFGAWRSWCFGASWPFGALRLFDALALLGALRLRGSVTLWHFAALWDMPSWKKNDFVDFTFFKHRLKHRYKNCFGEKTKGQIVCIWGPALTCSQRTYDYLFSNFCGLFNDGLP